jgi:hypothetical protein
MCNEWTTVRHEIRLIPFAQIRRFEVIVVIAHAPMRRSGRGTTGRHPLSVSVGQGAGPWSGHRQVGQSASSRGALHALRGLPTDVRISAVTFSASGQCSTGPRPGSSPHRQDPDPCVKTYPTCLRPPIAWRIINRARASPPSCRARPQGDTNREEDALLHWRSDQRRSVVDPHNRACFRYSRNRFAKRNRNHDPKFGRTKRYNAASDVRRLRVGVVTRPPARPRAAAS